MTQTYIDPFSVPDLTAVFDMDPTANGSQGENWLGDQFNRLVDLGFKFGANYLDVWAKRETDAYTNEQREREAANPTSRSVASPVLAAVEKAAPWLLIVGGVVALVALFKFWK